MELYKKIAGIRTMEEYYDMQEELKTLYARAQRALGKYVGTDEQVTEKEKAFEKERKSAEKVSKKQIEK